MNCLWATWRSRGARGVAGIKFKWKDLNLENFVNNFKRKKENFHHGKKKNGDGGFKETKNNKNHKRKNRTEIKLNIFHVKNNINMIHSKSCHVVVT